MKDGGEKIIGSGGDENTDEREKVRRGDHSAFLFGARAMLDQGVQGNSKEPAEKAEQAQVWNTQTNGGYDEVTKFYRRRAALMERSGAEPVCKQFGRLAEVKQRSENRHAERANGNQAHFDFAARKITGGKTTESYTDADGGLQVTGARVVNVQHVMAVHHDGELQQRGEKPQISVTDYGPEKHGV